MKQDSTTIVIAVSLLFLITSVLAAYADGNLVYVPRDISELAWRRKNPEKVVWYDIVDKATSPEDVCRTVKRFVRYQEDTTDEWTSGKETWKRGYGDCEDIAACVVELCKEIGLDARIQIFYPKNGGGTGHAVAAGTWNGQMWMSSNGSFERVESSDKIKQRNAEILNHLPRDVATADPADLKGQSNISQHDHYSHTSFGDSLKSAKTSSPKQKKSNLRQRDHYLQVDYVDVI